MLGEALNVSPHGVFVRASQLFDVGTELICDLAFPADDRITVRGRVAWQQQSLQRSEQGMGIAFCEGYTVRGATLLGLGQSELAQPELSEVWFEGMAEPVAAEWMPSAEGGYLRTWLPFLRPQARVRLALGGPAAEPVDAVVRSATLVQREPEGAPCLEVRLAVPEAQQWPTWSTPEPVRDRSSAPTPAEARTAATVPAAPRAEPMAQEASEPALTAASSWGPGAADLAHDHSHWSLNGTSSDTLLDRAAREGDADFWGERPRRHGRSWLWFAALATAAVGIGLTVYTGLWARVAQGPEPAPIVVPRPDPEAEALAAFAPPAPTAPTLARPAPAQPARAAAGEVAAPTPPAPPSAPKVVVARAPQPASAVPPAPARVTSPAAPPAEATRRPPQGQALSAAAGPEVIRTREGAMLSVAIAGSIAGVKHYAITKPDGVVVRLPQARPALPFADYALDVTGGFRLLWVRPQEQGGVQLRFLFAQPGQRYSVAIEPRRVRVTLLPDPAPDPLVPGLPQPLPDPTAAR